MLRRYYAILVGKSQALLAGTLSWNLSILDVIWEISLSSMSAELALLFPSHG